MNKGVISIGVKAPIIRQGDDLVRIVIDSIKASGVKLKNRDVIGITESVVARAQDNYVTIDDIVQFLDENGFSKSLLLFNPIMSRNRFSLILKAFARYADDIEIMLNGDCDEQGNPNYGVNVFTGVDMQEYYKEICDNENCVLKFSKASVDRVKKNKGKNKFFIDCSCHPENQSGTTLDGIMYTFVYRKDGTQSGYNNFYGLLGSNKADEETLKLFPNVVASINLVYEIQQKIKDEFGKNVEVMIYGDGCFKDPVGGIWEFADPVTSPAYTDGLHGTPNEIKVKYFADSKYKHLSGQELEDAIAQEIKIHKDRCLVGSMTSEGTTPRRYIDLLASLMDLTSGSGSRCTPIVIVQNYFD